MWLLFQPPKYVCREKGIEGGVEEEKLASVTHFWKILTVYIALLRATLLHTKFTDAIELYLVT